MAQAPENASPEDDLEENIQFPEFPRCDIRTPHLGPIYLIDDYLQREAQRKSCRSHIGGKAQAEMSNPDYAVQTLLRECT